MDKLFEIMNNSTIPKKTRDMINRLSLEGKRALNSMYDEDSDFFKHAQPVKLADKFFADPKKYPVLYHYTDFNGLNGILSSKSFRIGSQYYMNDPNENIYVFKLAKEYLVNNNVANDEIDFFKNDYHREQFDPYIWSFTYNDHSEALLAYGDFALEFYNQELENNLVIQLNPGIDDFNQMCNGNSYVFPLKVEYNVKIQKEYIKSVMRTYLGAVRNLNIDPYDMYEVIKDCYAALNFFGLCFKNPILYQEEEIRFVVFRRNDNNTLCPNELVNGRPTVIFPFSLDLIKKIIYSRNIVKLNSVKKLLKSVDLDTTLLEKTKLPYGRKTN